jgi:hypothetical protein
MHSLISQIFQKYTDAEGQFEVLFEVLGPELSVRVNDCAHPAGVSLCETSPWAILPLILNSEINRRVSGYELVTWKLPVKMRIPGFIE